MISNVIIESYSLIVIQAIRRETKPLSQIWNLVEDIIVLARTLENIKFWTVLDLLNIRGQGCKKGPSLLYSNS